MLYEHFLKYRNEHDVSALCIKPLIWLTYCSANLVSSLDRNAYSAYDLRLRMVFWVIMRSSFVGGLNVSEEPAASILLIKRTSHVPYSHDGPSFPHTTEHGGAQCFNSFTRLNSRAKGHPLYYHYCHLTLSIQIGIRHDNLFAKYKLTGS
jgi:hypothetical protein